MGATTADAATAAIAGRVIVVRGMRVLIDADLATLYGVETRSLNQAVRRNKTRFPADFMFTLEPAEWESLRSQFVILNKSRGSHRKYPPVAFTEHGAIMAATILNSDRAVQMSVYVVRAFVQLRALLASKPELARKLADLEESVANLDRNTRRRFEEVYSAIRALTAEPARRGRPIGFTADVT
jgi:phage regulator Rha-like protein